MMNVAKEHLDQIKQAMPGLNGPTVSNVLSNEGIMAVHAVVDEKMFNLVNKLKLLGPGISWWYLIERII